MRLYDLLKLLAASITIMMYEEKDGSFVEIINAEKLMTDINCNRFMDREIGKIIPMSNAYLITVFLK